MRAGPVLPLGAAVAAREVRVVPAVAVGQTGDLFAAPAEALPAVWHRFARGALAGNFLHDQLEWLAAEGFDVTRPDVAERLKRQCERAGRLAQADEVAQLVLFLASEGSAFITGEDFVIDGGFTAGAGYRRVAKETGLL